MPDVMVVIQLPHCEDVNESELQAFFEDACDDIPEGAIGTMAGGRDVDVQVR